MYTESWLPKHTMGRVVLLLSLLFILLLMWFPILEMFYWSFFVKEPGQFDCSNSGKGSATDSGNRFHDTTGTGPHCENLSRKRS